MSKRYEALYINPNFCDGFWDNEKDFYLNDDEIKHILYENLTNEEIEEILNRNIEEKEENEVNEEMGEAKLALEGVLLLLYGLISIAWIIIKIISCVFIAGYLATKTGLVGNYWWFAGIIIFSILSKIIFFGSTTNAYNQWIDNYKEKTNN